MISSIPVIPLSLHITNVPFRCIPLDPSLLECGSRMVWHWMSLKSSKTWSRRCLCTSPHTPQCSMNPCTPHAAASLLSTCDVSISWCPLSPHASLCVCACVQSFKKWMETYQAELAQKKNMGIFTKLGQCGLISFSDYMFLLVVLSSEWRICVCWCRCS